jgi:hypothetical protein
MFVRQVTRYVDPEVEKRSCIFKKPKTEGFFNESNAKDEIVSRF